MAITLADINKLRQKTQAGLMDCKKALTEANGDFEAAMDILRKKGQMIAAKRSDREASEGCVLVKVDGNFGAIVALKCETDFVAKNADFVGLTQQILDAAVAARCKTAEEVLALNIDGVSAADAITNRSGVTGEKMELGGYCVAEGESIISYNHMNKNSLCTLVVLNKQGFEEVGKGVAMQAAAMSPIALDESGVSEEVKAAELKNSVEKAKQNQIGKAVENALKKAGINPAHVDSEDHIESNIGKGWITAEDAAKAREIKTTVAAEAEANLKPAMIENIAKGMVNKFFKENCLLDQAYIDDNKISVAQYVKNADKDLAVVDFKRFTLSAE
ncbi:MAG: translation elongation factor Ts [Bacteroidaceae bacterium]|nr:translation elongation factor Ts [Bacteroidaceae bacterium]